MTEVYPSIRHVIKAKQLRTCGCGAPTRQCVKLCHRSYPVCADCERFVLFNLTNGNRTMHFVRRDDAWCIWLAPEAYTAFAALCNTLGMPLQPLQ